MPNQLEDYLGKDSAETSGALSEKALNQAERERC